MAKRTNHVMVKPLILVDDFYCLIAFAVSSWWLSNVKPTYSLLIFVQQYIGLEDTTS